ncbi:MAG: restriction endonuclease [Candidatus Nealsonbacteria bacterium]|nr:restriction endonuclease [Candidatus Nealsonbacteria bacterium]
MDIIKASGEKEKFDKEKFCRSLRRAGADSEAVQKICGAITKEVYPGISSREIFEKTQSFLKKDNPILAARYNLKRAIMRLGPTGFPFEKYIAGVLEEYGYTTQVGKQVMGRCVTHEVDVIAQKEGKHFMIECKYHNSGGIRSDLKVALYTYARFLDVEEEWRKIPGHKNFFHQAWLVTNTKCTSQAIKYANCAGLKILSWRYPKGGSLENLIERKGLYPITILPSFARYAGERLAQQGIMLTKNLLQYSADSLSKRTGLKLHIIQRLQAEAKQIINS